MRLELTTSAVTGRRSNQLSHWALLYYIRSTQQLTFSAYVQVDLRGLEPRTDRL